jgi:hypothetical protein
MNNTIQFGLGVAAIFALSAAMSFALSGEATYKTTCQSFHCAAGWR